MDLQPWFHLDITVITLTTLIQKRHDHAWRSTCHNKSLASHYSYSFQPQEITAAMRILKNEDLITSLRFYCNLAASARARLKPDLQRLQPRPERRRCPIQMSAQVLDKDPPYLLQQTQF